MLLEGSMRVKSQNFFEEGKSKSSFRNDIGARADFPSRDC